MRDRPDDLIAVIVITLLLVLLIDFDPNSPLRVGLGLVFLLALPGYTVAAAIFPDKHNVDVVERVALSVGLSVAIVPLTGLFIFKLVGGLEFRTLEIVLTAFVIIVSFIAWARRLGIPADERFAIDTVIDLGPGKVPMVDRLLVVGIAVALVIIFVMLAFIASTPTKREGYTVLGIIGPGGDLREYPTDLTIDQVGMINVSVASHEMSDTQYSLVILLQEENHTGANITHWRSGNPFSNIQPFTHGLAMAYNFTLAPEKSLNSSFEFRVSENGTFKLRFMLFYEGENPGGEPSYENWLWLSVKTAV